MFAACLAAFFFALNATVANRSVKTVGPMQANLGRLVVAAVVLGLFAHTLGHGLTGAGTRWFFLSGVMGMGLGDLAVFAALPLLGSRLTVLMTQCLAAPVAALMEWLWLGTRLTTLQAMWGALILVGVAVAIMPGRKSPPRVQVQPIGFLFGFLAACGQGVGAVISRQGNLAAIDAGESVANLTFGLNAAYLRILAGLAFTILWFLTLHFMGRRPATPLPEAGTPAVRRRNAWLILANGLCGPVAGVGCYQWALATTPSGIVLPIAATTPLIAIPIAYWFEGERPQRRSIAGGLLAVAGCIALALVR